MTAPRRVGPPVALTFLSLPVRRALVSLVRQQIRNTNGSIKAVEWRIEYWRLLSARSPLAGYVRGIRRGQRSIRSDKAKIKLWQEALAELSPKPAKPKRGGK